VFELLDILESFLIHCLLVGLGFIFMVFMMVGDAVRPSIYVYV
jgi:hypothetical protein